jgi:hypothetical protein
LPFESAKLWPFTRSAGSTARGGVSIAVRSFPGHGEHAQDRVAEVGVAVLVAIALAVLAFEERDDVPSVASAVVVKGGTGNWMTARDTGVPVSRSS